MAERSLRQAFDVLLARSVPTAAERAAAASHRESIESCLSNSLDLYSMRETGSFHHGTGVRGYSDIDVLVAIRASRPTSSDTALAWVKSALLTRFKSTSIRISRPAVVVDFAGGSERWEIIPGFVASIEDGHLIYDIPGPSGGWMRSSPTAHLKYVTTVNKSPDGGAKGLARLIKRWKYENSAALISSFYLEMRAAQYMEGEQVFLADMDFERLMRRLASSELQGMNDPMGITGRIEAASTAANRVHAAGRVRYDSQRVTDALAAEKAGDRAVAFALLDVVFLGSFPSQFY